MKIKSLQGEFVNYKYQEERNYYPVKHVLSTNKVKKTTKNT